MVLFMSCFVQFVFRNDCMFSTTFANLKELVLNEWCMVPNFAALDYFLRYSPILEKLTLQLECFEVNICSRNKMILVLNMPCTSD